MKKKIQDLIRGTYKYEHPKLIFSDETIKFDVREEETYKGSFRITVSGKQYARGIISCKNPRMKCLTDQFEGTEIQVDYVYEASNVKAGNPDSGQFVILSDCGEYLLPFTAEPVRYYHKSSIGKIKTLNDFANLAKLNWEEALNVFQSKYFHNIFPDTASELLYEGLCSRGCTGHEMEEFLIGIGKKKRSQIVLDQMEFDLGKISEDTGRELKLSRTEWGYADVQISCDAPFIRLEKTRISSDDFVGKKAVVPYSVCVDRMHDGMNCAKITLQSEAGSSFVQIRVRKTVENRPDVLCAARRFQRNAMFSLTRAYIDYRLDRMSLEDWVQNSLDIIQEMEEHNPADVWSLLYKCHVLLLSGRREEAGELFEEISVRCKKKHTIQWGYARFLDFIYQNGTDIADTEAEKNVLIQDLQMVIRKNPDQLLPILLIISLCEDHGEQLKEKYDGIKNCIKKGWASPLLYMEAYLILKSHPQILRGVDAAEFRILYWIARRKLLTEQMVTVIVNASGREKQFHPRFFWLLGRCYKVMKSDLVIRAVCTYLIKNNQSGEMYLSWFAKGVGKHMRIAGLFEAYLQSWHKNDGDIPKNVIQYFSQKTELPTAYRARIYAYAVRKRKSLGREWQIYEKLAAAFVTEELQKQHMSDDIAEICRYFILYRPGEVRREVLEQSLHHYKVTCSEGNFSSVVICDSAGTTTETVPLIQNTAFFMIHGTEYRILFEDNFGRRCCLTEGFRLNPVIPGKDRKISEQEYGIDIVEQKTAAANETEQIESVEKPDEEVIEQDSYYDMLGLETMAGSIEELDRAIRQAETSGVDVSEYQEQLLTRMVFTELFPEDHVEYFRAVCKLPHTEQLRQAYVSCFARKYVYEDAAVPEEIFEYLQYSFKHGRKINYCCESAMLKWYCEHGWEGKEKEFRNLFESALRQGRYFAFYTRLPEAFLEKYLIHDRQYLWLSERPEQTIHCEIRVNGRGTVRTEDLTVRESIPGLYVLSVYLFAGDLMEYRFYNAENQTLKSGTERLTPSETLNPSFSRYYLLNQALEEPLNQTEKLKKYAEMTDMAADLFQPL